MRRKHGRSRRIQIIEPVSLTGYAIFISAYPLGRWFIRLWSTRRSLTQGLVAATTSSVDVTARISARNFESFALPKAASNPA
jgi:hypothetical protein